MQKNLKNYNAHIMLNKKDKEKQKRVIVLVPQTHMQNKQIKHFIPQMKIFSVFKFKLLNIWNKETLKKKTHFFFLII